MVKNSGEIRGSGNSPFSFSAAAENSPRRTTFITATGLHHKVAKLNLWQRLAIPLFKLSKPFSF